MSKADKTQLIQTAVCSIVYGQFGGEYQELFRCQRELDDVDLRGYVNDSRCVLGFENDDTKNGGIDGRKCIGYFRLYFKNGWLCRWYSRQEKGTVTVDDVFKEACREKKHLTVGDILNNQEFDFNANFAIYECSKDVTWNDLDAPAYDTKLCDKDNKIPLESFYDCEIRYMTIHDHALIIEVGKED